MNLFKELHNIMDEFSEKIAIEISEKRMFQISEIKAIAKVHLWFSIKECLKLQITELEKKHRHLSELYNNQNVPNYKKIKIASDLNKLKSEKKDANKLLHIIFDYDEYTQLKKYIEQKYGYSILEDFYENYCNSDSFKKRKTENL